MASLFVGQAPQGLAPIDPSKETTRVMRADINKHHVEYQIHEESWLNCQLMYEGGDAIKASKDRFLRRRPKEDNTVFATRMDQFDYENNIGTALGWHEASMFEDEPSITIRTKGADGTPTDAKLNPDQEAFYHERFFKNCDRQGTTFVNFFRTIFNSLLLFRHAFICVDLPTTDESVGTLQQQKEQGLLDPYLCSLTPLDIINWNLDEYQNLKWCVLYSKTEAQDFLGKPTRVERWYYYDKTMYRVYEAITDMTKENSIEGTSTAITTAVESVNQDGGDKVPVNLVRVGYHVLAKYNMVPVIKLSVPKGWWMANRAYLPAMEHINISNVLQWSLFMTGTAIPVVFTDDDVTKLTMSETGFWKFSENSKVQYLEPSGKVWAELASRAQTLKEEIWRAFYLVSQARNTSATAMSASGASKQQDMQPSHDVLNGLGETLRSTMQFILGIVAKARATLPGTESDGVLIFDVRGYSFEDKITVDDIAVIQDLLDLNVPSDRFYKELCKMSVRAGLKNANPDTLRDIDKEIEAAPTRDEQAQIQESQQQLAQQKLMRQQLTGITKDDPEGA